MLKFRKGKIGQIGIPGLCTFGSPYKIPGREQVGASNHEEKSRL